MINVLSQPGGNVSAQVKQKTPSYAGFSPASTAASKTMRANVKTGGLAERTMRGLLWRRGLRFRVHVQSLPGCPDIFFPRHKVCIFCDGDFWHGRNWPALQEDLQRRSNPAYWVPKIQRNMERDQEQAVELEALGWTVIRLWETDILRDSEQAVLAVVQILTARKVPEPPHKPNGPRAVTHRSGQGDNS